MRENRGQLVGKSPHDLKLVGADQPNISPSATPQQASVRQAKGKKKPKRHKADQASEPDPAYGEMGGYDEDDEYEDDGEQPENA